MMSGMLQLVGPRTLVPNGRTQCSEDVSLECAALSTLWPRLSQETMKFSLSVGPRSGARPPQAAVGRQAAAG